MTRHHRRDVDAIVNRIEFLHGPDLPIGCHLWDDDTCDGSCTEGGLCTPPATAAHREATSD